MFQKPRKKIIFAINYNAETFSPSILDFINFLFRGLKQKNRKQKTTRKTAHISK